MSEVCVLILSLSQGCVLKLKNWVEENMAVFGGMGIFIGLTQVSEDLAC